MSAAEETPEQAEPAAPATGLSTREDFREIARLVRPGSRVLDVGCGEGALLELLSHEKAIDGRGLEISAEGVAACLARGLAVVQGDADRDLDYFPERAFDYAVLSQTLQAVREPRHVLFELLRIAERAVVSFPNFGHWRVRLSLFLKGRMPVTKDLPYSWYDTPNIHFCTIRDFVNLCDEVGAKVESATALDANGQKIGFSMPWWFWNFFGQQAVFLLKR
jgi:methionine biosynthesis protein MetW